MTSKRDPMAPAEPKPVQRKSEIVERLLSRKSGATATEIAAATAWQPHSVRAYLSGLRKKGSVVSREDRRDGTKAYRLGNSPAPAANLCEVSAARDEA